MTDACTGATATGENNTTLTPRFKQRWIDRLTHTHTDTHRHTQTDTHTHRRMCHVHDFASPVCTFFVHVLTQLLVVVVVVVVLVSGCVQAVA